MIRINAVLICSVAFIASCDERVTDSRRGREKLVVQESEQLVVLDEAENLVHPDFQKEGMSEFFKGRWAGGEQSPNSYFEYRADGTCSFQIEDFRYSGPFEYKPCKMTTWFKKGDRDYIVMFSLATEEFGIKRLDGVAEVFIGYDREPRFRERALDLILYKKGEQSVPPKFDRAGG